MQPPSSQPDATPLSKPVDPAAHGPEAHRAGEEPCTSPAHSLPGDRLSASPADLSLFGDDRRASDRVAFPVLVQIIDDQGPELLRARDISHTGVRFLLPHSAVGTRTPKRVVIRGALPGTNSVFWAVGQVVRGATSKLGVELGVRFTFMTQENVERVSRYIALRS